jgi:tetratricopeptide (TPR) repeat protein
MGLRFGELAVLNGWIKSTTINFFLEHLNFAQEYYKQSLEQERPPDNNILQAPLTDDLSSGIIQLLSSQSSPDTDSVGSLSEITPNSQSPQIEESIHQSAWLENPPAKLPFLSKESFSATSSNKNFPPNSQHISVEKSSNSTPGGNTEETRSVMYNNGEYKRTNSTNWDAVVKEVLSWTGEQPFLTQKLWQLLGDSRGIIPQGEEAATVTHLVQTYVIDNWETQVASEHLQAIREGILANQQCEPVLLLKLYQRILQEGEVFPDKSLAQTELVSLGLIVQDGEKLKLYNRIYQSVFNQDWVEQELKTRHKPKVFDAVESTQSKVLQETPTLKAPSTVSHVGDKSFRHLWILLGVVSLLVVGLNIFKSLEEKLLFIKGNELFHQGEYQKAIAKYSELLNINSNYYQAWTNRGYALSGLQEYKQMQESCSAATIIEPKAVYAWNCQGEALYNLKQYKEAIADFDKAIALDAKDPVFWINKTESLLAIKQPDEAITSVNQAIVLLQQNISSDNRELINRNLSVAFSHKGKAFLQKQEYQQALEADDKSLEYDPNYWDAQQSRGIALQGLRRYNEATTQFNQMLNESKLRDSQKAETWYYLGLTLCQASKPKEALSAFDEALKLRQNYQAAELAKRNCD